MTAGKDTADLICFEQTSSLKLNAIYNQRAKDDALTHKHILSQVGPGHTHFPVTPTGS